MATQPKKRYISYRCPECLTATTGLVGKFALAAGLLRLKCNCDKGSSLDISVFSDGKIKLSVPCIFCKQNHSYLLNETVFFDRDRFMLSCPYSGTDIAFLGDEENIREELQRTESEIKTILAGFEAEDISDIQPQDMNEDEILPDPAVYDTIKFLISDLEDDGHISCLCNNGKYELRFTENGVQVYCENCGASYTFNAQSPSLAEEYLSIDEIKLK